MKVYVVLEEDRGCGPSVVLVTFNKAKASEVAMGSSHFWMEECEMDEADLQEAMFK